MKLLELFKGTGSAGKAAVKVGFNEIVSIDFDQRYKPTIHTDILEWDYKKFYEETKFIPDFIWASPPCNTYSVLSYIFKERDTKTAKPLSERALTGTKILYRTLEIIMYFQDLNPDLGFCIENPRGMMRYDPNMLNLHRETTLYCLYGDTKRKPTDFWSNFKTNLLPITTPYDKSKVVKNLANLSLKDRYLIPEDLIIHIYRQYLQS